MVRRLHRPAWRDPHMNRLVATPHDDLAMIAKPLREIVASCPPRRLDDGRTEADVGVELPAGRFEPAGDVAGITDDREGQDAFAADRTENDRSVLATDARVDRRKTRPQPRGAPVADLLPH